MRFNSTRANSGESFEFRFWSFFPISHHQTARFTSSHDNGALAGDVFRGFVFFDDDHDARFRRRYLWSFSTSSSSRAFANALFFPEEEEEEEEEDIT
jgi:hypothetical protein